MAPIFGAIMMPWDAFLAIRQSSPKEKKRKPTAGQQRNPDAFLPGQQASFHHQPDRSLAIKTGHLDLLLTEKKKECLLFT